MSDLLAQLPQNLGSHVLLTLVALGVGAAISLPLAVVLVRVQPLRGPTLAIAGVLQTIPSLALLALMVPVLVGVHEVAARIGVDTPTLGFLPAVLALTVYSVLPILRNTVTGIAGVDPALTDAARGLGMTSSQVLWQVELPLAAPVIFAGLRTAAVWVVGTATLATPVGQNSLGNYIFAGLQTRSWAAVLLGCALAAGLAVVIDAVLAVMERGSPRARWVAGGVGFAVLASVAALPTLATLGRGEVVTIGAKTFTEQFVLARLLQRRLEAAGVATELREGLGSTIAFDALGTDVDLYVDYSGTVWANHMGRDPAPRDTVLTEMSAWLAAERGVHNLGALGFENAYALAMRGDRARDLGVTDLVGLSGVSADLSIGADYEFFGRPEWASVRDGYGLRFGQQRTLDPALMYGALTSGEVDVITAFSSDGRIAALDLAVMGDPRHALPPYDAVLLVAADVADQPRVRLALEPLVGAIDVGLMREANRLVDQDGESPAAAAAWLDGTLAARR